MRDQILKLCRRLDKFTLDEIMLISEVDSEELVPILNSFKTENKLVLNKGVYTYKDDSEQEESTYSILEYYPPYITELAIRCFCSDITAEKARYLLGIGNTQTYKYYKIFREKLYERQYKLLENYYSKKPQIAKQPTFCNKKAYLYVYDKQVFIAEKPFNTINEQFSETNQKTAYKNIYLYLRRVLYHNTNYMQLHHKIAEAIWKRNKNFEDRYSDLKNLIF